MIKVIISFSRVTDSDLAVQAQHIVDSLTDNAAFPTPAPALADVQSALTDYETALAQAATGGKQLTAVKNQKRETLETLLSQLGLYVQLHSNNDAAVALSSGFTLAKTPAPVGMLSKSENLKAVPGITGEILLSVYAVPHAAGYIWQYKLAGADAWMEIHTTKAKTAVEGLTSGQQYSFRVTALGTNPAQNWSDEVKSFVL
ncbi:hypothetical protein A9P82_04990 [Arachidicoccus ginsenosidimutans]|uniref:fibronectin type III domain-containing protein n=1 Tax=Arachidicoccus sp. BS20 TaxID=1850526 RepID=UPI0007F12C35|nr:fibronectin type III domain-containing protein [Arachidicoccus sp. BS20]ANI88698.1 hypothetical protein A9P82_04990 [Arachidicoccus sp. BS20]